VIQNSHEAGFGWPMQLAAWAPVLPPNQRIESDRRKRGLRYPRALPSAAPHARR